MALGDFIVRGMVRSSVNLYIGFGASADCCTGLSARLTGPVSRCCLTKGVGYCRTVPYGEPLAAGPGFATRLASLASESPQVSHL